MVWLFVRTEILTEDRDGGGRAAYERNWQNPFLKLLLKVIEIIVRTNSHDVKTRLEQFS